MTSTTFFDIASLTKPLATTLIVLSLMGEGKLDWDDPLEKLFSGPLPAEKRKITLEHLLSHSAGLAAHKPFFRHLKSQSPHERAEEIINAVLREPLVYPPGSGCLYSDLGFLLLGRIVERAAGGMGIAEIFSRKISKPLGIAKEIFFRSQAHRGEGEQFAATESCPWRGRTLQGEVHDEHAWCMGGAAGHAGLFATNRGVLQLTEYILNLRLGRISDELIRRADLLRCLQRIHPDHSWARGFDTPSSSGSSSGSYFSPDSVGHLGFTGTSFWIDPERDIIVVLLTNRVHPTRENRGIREFRPRCHDAVMEWFLAGDRRLEKR